MTAVTSHMFKQELFLMSFSRNCSQAYQPLIAPSILSANFLRLGQEIADVTQAGADWIHFDVMDNHYVPNLTFGPVICEALRPAARIPIDVHLMTDTVEDLVARFAKSGADSISFHCEATPHIDRALTFIRDSGAKAGLAFTPTTPLEYLDYVLDKLDFVLLMTVNPGFGGQKFIPASVKRIQRVHEILSHYQSDTGRKILLEVDGGINASTIAGAALAGADVFVAGSAVFNCKDPGGYKNAIESMKAIAAKAVENKAEP